MTGFTTPPVPPAKDRLRLWLRLLKVSRMVEAHLRERLRAEFDTTLPRFDMMAALSRHEKGLKMSALSGVLRVSNGNVTGLVDRLTSEGLAERLPVPGDRRAYVVRLTPRGRAEFAQQAAAHERWIDDLMAGLPADEVRAMSDRLACLAEGAETREGAHAQ